ncbi:MAG: S9 family peptidase, partial [Parvularculaceae bacterium]|nr:S9 family peptidase [Parvularculaceae bacterium]
EKGAVHLFKVNVNNGALKRVAKGSPNTEDWISDIDGNPMIRVDGGGSTRYAGWRPLTVLYTPDDKGNWQKVRSYSRTRDTEQKNFVPAGRTTSNDQYGVISFTDSDEWATLKQFDLRSNQLGETLGAIEGADVTSTILNPRDKRVIGVAGWRDEREMHFFDPALQKRWDRIEELLGEQRNAQLWSASDDFSKIVVVATGPTSAGYYSLYDADSDTLRSLFPRNKRISSRNLGKAEVIQYTARDGLPLTAYVTHPHGVAADEPAPLIVRIHGGPHARDRFDYNPEVQFLTSRGYRVVQPYFRGSTGKGRTFMEQGYGEWGLTMQDDITDAVLALKERGLADPNTTCIVGGSYGGYAALFAQIKTPDLFSCSVAVAAVTDLKRQLRYDMEIFLRGTTMRTSVEATLATDSGALSLNDRSPAKQIGKMTKPVLIAHGEQDWRVPWRITKDFWSRMKSSDTPTASIIFEHESHAGWSDRAELFYHDCLEDFLAVNIGGKVSGTHTPTWDNLRCPGRMND